MLLAPKESADARRGHKGNGHGRGGDDDVVRASPTCEDYVGHAMTREMRRGATFEAPTPSTYCLHATNWKTPTVRRSRPIHAPCATAMGSCVPRAKKAGAAMDCTLGMAERDEQSAGHGGVPRLQGGRYVRQQKASRDRRANLVHYVWEAHAGLACVSGRDHVHAVEAKVGTLRLARELDVQLQSAGLEEDGI